jgi:hypothetical protein
MDSLMMVITTLCDCIGAVDESNSPNAFCGEDEDCGQD